MAVMKMPHVAVTGEDQLMGRSALRVSGSSIRPDEISRRRPAFPSSGGILTD